MRWGGIGRGGKGQREVRRDGEQWRVIGSGEKGPGVVGRNRERWGGIGGLLYITAITD